MNHDETAQAAQENEKMDFVEQAKKLPKEGRDKLTAFAAGLLAATQIDQRPA